MSGSKQNLYCDAIRRRNVGRPPVWFMRQAGRYHAHYQGLRARHSFIELCKLPEVACEVTFGPLDDFGFDAAILFSDLLFPLEAMGMGLRYDEGPRLDWHLERAQDLSRLKSGRELVSQMQFQADALNLIRFKLPAEKGLIGFVGGPLTLYFYAVEGSHKNTASEKPFSALKGLEDGRYAGFCEKLNALLVANMELQARAGADCVAVFDTCGGELDPLKYREFAVPALRRVLEEFRGLCPGTPVTYYSKGTGPAHWDSLRDLPIDCLGVDWTHDLAGVLTRFGDRFAIQGNIDPDWLFLAASELEAKLREVFTKVNALPAQLRRGWVCGLGHGVLPKTPESNVRLFLKIQKEMFS